MDRHVSRLEHFPNEILIEIFKNLDVRTLFHAFYNLNSRFSRLLQSLNHCLTIVTSRPDESHDDEIFFPYIRSLIIEDGIDITVNHLRNVRRIILQYSPGYSIRNFELNIAFNVEYFSIVCLDSSMLSLSTDFIRKIFSDGFPCLKSCCLYGNTPILVTEGWTESPSLLIFKTGYIRYGSYKAILASSPNLYSFQFSKWLLDKPTYTRNRHINLKRLTIDLSPDEFLNHHRWDDYFLLIPKLERLILNVTLYEPKNVKPIEDFDWFASMINNYLSMLQRFSCHVIFHRSTNVDQIKHEDFINKLKNNFEKKHNHRYQSKVAFKFPQD
jgi:hypothetical protein